MANTKTTTQVTAVSFSAPSAAASEASIFTQLAEDSNAELSAGEFLSLDSSHWDFISLEIGRLVDKSLLPGKSSDEVSLIYGEIMLIITCQYLPTISNYLGDQIAQQAATEDIASDVSAFILDAENGFNALATTNSSDSENSLFNATMSLIGSSVGGVSSLSYSFDVKYTLTTTVVDFEAGTTSVSQNKNLSTTEASVLAFLTDPTIWLKQTSTNGSAFVSSGVTPLSTSGASQISTAMADIPTNFNASQVVVPYGQTSTSASTPQNANLSGPNLAATAPLVNTWTNANLTDLAEITYTWTQAYGASTVSSTYPSGIPLNYGSSNSPLVYTAPNSIQADLNQASQAVQTVSTTQQTIQNFTVQEIDQYYGITNSIQQSQESQCAAIVKHYSG